MVKLSRLSRKEKLPSLTERELMLKIIEREKDCRQWVEGWIKQKTKIKKINGEIQKFKLRIIARPLLKH